MLGKVKQLELSRTADLIVLDAPAAGHAVNFLLSPRGLLDAVKVGPIQKQASEVVELLTDPARCQVLLVTLPEETPVNELIDTAYAVEDRAGVALGPIVVNGCMPPMGPVGDGELDDELHGRAGVRADAAATGWLADEHELDALARAAEFRAGLLHRQAVQCARLDAGLPLPQLRLPYFFTADVGPAEIEVLADELTLGIAALDDMSV